MVEQQEPTSYVNPYKFNAKELDSETGLYYYGARYYNPRISIWYGVDPLAEKLPTWSPYSYAFDNPVRFIDPDGRSPKDIIIIGPNGAFKAGKDMMYSTPQGKALWDKYGNSKTDDIYIGFSSLQMNSSAGSQTLALTEYDVFNSYSPMLISKTDKGIVSLNEKYKNLTVAESLLPFNGLDVSGSDGKKIHFMALNSNYFSEENNKNYSSWKYKYAEVIYHEMNSHIDKHGIASALRKYIKSSSGVDVPSTIIEHLMYGSDSSNGINKYENPQNDYQIMNNVLYDKMIEESSKKTK